MRKILLLTASLMLFLLDVSAQLATNRNGFLNSLEARSAGTQSWEGVDGDPYLYTAWITGEVVMETKDTIANLPLRFDLASNRLTFQRDQKILEFVDPVHQFSLLTTTAGRPVKETFRCGYPAVDNQTEKSFYQVLADGRFQLLEYRYKYVNEYHNYNEAPGKEFKSDEKLYACPPGHRMILLKKNKKDLVDALPQYAGLISKIEKEKRLKLKNTGDLALLFEALGKEAR